MGGQPVPGISCILCSKPVDLQTDLCSNENGMAVHEDCYVQQITTTTRGNSAFRWAIKLKVVTTRGEELLTMTWC
jgi:hypothetical protein